MPRAQKRHSLGAETAEEEADETFLFNVDRLGKKECFGTRSNSSQSRISPILRRGRRDSVAIVRDKNHSRKETEEARKVETKVWVCFCFFFFFFFCSSLSFSLSTPYSLSLSLSLLPPLFLPLSLSTLSLLSRDHLVRRGSQSLLPRLRQHPLHAQGALLVPFSAKGHLEGKHKGV